jgi:decaprenylphospho-beta-D-erythro-pentofuranosid-2-ulose 2-reductase
MSSSSRRIVVVGATSSMAEHCARLWADQSPSEFVLVVRDATRVERIAADLRVRGASGVRVLESRFDDPAAIADLVRRASSDGPPDIVLVAHGNLPNQTRCQEDLAACADALTVNGVSPALFAEGFAAGMFACGSGTLVVIGSVAGDRGRRSNYAYGAAKGLVTRYVQGLQHRSAGTAVRIVLVKPGPTATPMTRHLAACGAKLASVEDVAVRIVAAVSAGTPTVYAPAKWALIMMVIRHLPRRIFDRMNV